MFSKAFVHKRPHEYRKDWRPGGYKGILVGFDEVSYSVWVPELGTVVQSSDVVVDEMAQGEVDQGEIYGLSEKEISEVVDKEYTEADFDYLKGTVHTDNENGLNYEVTDIRRHRTRSGFQIVVDRKCLVGGATDTIYALDAAAMTAEALTAPVELSAAVSAGPAAACERRGAQQSSESSRSRELARACEIGDLGLVHELVASGANVNSKESSGSGLQPSKNRSDSVPGGTKRPLDGLDPLVDPGRRRSSRLIGNPKPINYNLTMYTLVESHQADGEIRSYFIPKTYAQAIACEDSAHWIKAMEEELAGLNDAGCFEVEILPEGANAIPSKWIFTVKTDSLGRLVRFKARLVAGGHRQLEGIDFVETFPPTVSWDAVR